jgi:hypothetical protein
VELSRRVADDWLAHHLPVNPIAFHHAQGDVIADDDSNASWHSGSLVDVAQNAVRPLCPRLRIGIFPAEAAVDRAV